MNDEPNLILYHACKRNKFNYGAVTNVMISTIPGYNYWLAAAVV